MPSWSPLLTWVPPCGDLDERKHPSLQLRELWKDDAWQRLWAALDTAFGGFPSGVRTWPLVLRGGADLVAARGHQNWMICAPLPA
jgi:hypothetical protein